LGDDSDLEMIIVVGWSPAVALETRAIWSWQSNCSRLLLLMLPNVVTLEMHDGGGSEKSLKNYVFLIG
jgi:hypothetical protein